MYAFTSSNENILIRLSHWVTVIKDADKQIQTFVFYGDCIIQNKKEKEEEKGVRIRYSRRRNAIHNDNLSIGKKKKRKKK